MPYRTRYTIPSQLHSLIIALMFLFIIASPLYYGPLTGFVIEKLNSQSFTNVIGMTMVWIIISFLAALGLMDVICFILPLKKPIHEKH